MIIIMIIFQCQYLFLTFLLHLEIYTLIKSTRDVHAMLEKKKKTEMMEVIRETKAQKEHWRLDSRRKLPAHSYDLINRSKIADERWRRRVEVSGAPEAGSPACPSLRTALFITIETLPARSIPVRSTGSRRDRVLISISFRPAAAAAASPLFFYYPPRNERMLTREPEIIAPITIRSNRVSAFPSFTIKIPVLVTGFENSKMKKFKNNCICVGFDSSLSRG